jgi:CubicO group peptidase (beta-lactamase class C family)
MSFAKYRAVAVIVAVFLSFAGPGVTARTLDEANDLARQLVRQTMQDQRIPGLQVAVVRDGEVVLSESYGFANAENRVPVTRTTLFPINSATKPFTGVAMMQLVEAGLVDLDAPVSRYLDDLPAAWQKVRVRQLLAHTSGLPDIVDARGLIGGRTEADAWKAVRDLPTRAAGEAFVYNQTNYGLLARIIVKQTGMPYERYIAERQFKPTGMSQSRFGDSYDVVPNAATIYSFFPRETLAPDDATRLSRWINDMPYSLYAGGGILTTADDVAHWIAALTSGRLIGADSTKAMWIPEKLNDGKDGAWSAGWPVLATSPARQVAGIGGRRAAYIVYPDDGLAVVMLTNLVGADPQNVIPKIAELYKPLRSDRQQ